MRTAEQFDNEALFRFIKRYVRYCFIPPAVLLMPGETILMNVYPDRKSTRLNSSHNSESRMPSSA
jgi:hypothetical protein